MKKSKCKNGCEKAVFCRKVCRTCYGRIWYEESGRESRGAIKQDILPIGTIRLDVNGYQRIKINNGHGAKDWVKYYRYLMEQFLGRKLQPYENVHHKNGNRQDDRLDNYELWITKQPKGQRPEDLIEYAKWILKTYKNDKDKC